MKPKSNSVVTVQLLDDGRIQYDVLGATNGAVIFDPKKASASNRAHAEFHGWKQRGADGAALSRDTDTGQPASPNEKRERIAALMAFYEEGTDDWSRVGVGGGGKSLTVEAIAAEKGIDYDAAETMVEEFAKTGKDGKGNAFNGDTKKALAFLRQGAKVGARMEEIRKARMPAPKVDADAALNELK